MMNSYFKLVLGLILLIFNTSVIKSQENITKDCDCDLLNIQIDECRLRNKLYLSDSKKLGNQNIQLQSDLKKCKTKKSDLEKSIGILNLDLTLAYKQIEKFTKELKEKSDSINILVTQIMTLSKKCDSLDYILKITRDKLKTTENKLDLANSTIDKYIDVVIDLCVKHSIEAVGIEEITNSKKRVKKIKVLKKSDFKEILITFNTCVLDTVKEEFHVKIKMQAKRNKDPVEIDKDQFTVIGGVGKYSWEFRNLSEYKFRRARIFISVLFKGNEYPINSFLIKN